jgi:hypothetical protein
MKKKTILLFTFLFFTVTNLLQAQYSSVTNLLQAQYSSSEKATVYICSLEKNNKIIQYFNNNNLIGYTMGKEYLMYECNPGMQLFWSKVVTLKKKSPKAESFLELNLEPGMVYYLNAVTYKTSGKKLKKSVKKNKGNLEHNLVLLEDRYLINQFTEKISKKKPNVYKDKKLKKWNEQLYSQITTSLYEYNQTNSNKNKNSGISNSIIEESEEVIIPEAATIKENITKQLGDIIETSSSSTLEELEQSKLDAIKNEDFDLAEKIKNQINLKKQEEISKSEENNSSLEELQNEKQKAITDENFILANEIKEKINLKKEQEENEAAESKLKEEHEAALIKLQKEKEEAIINEDYIKAGELNKQLNDLNKNNTNKETPKKKAENLNVLIGGNKGSKVKKSYSNNREESLAVFINKNSKLGNNSTVNYATPFYNKKKNTKILKSSNNKNADAVNYSRSSLYTLMVNNDVSEHAQTIKDAFGNSPLQGKFNDHNIGPYYIDISYQEKDLSSDITSYLNTNNIAREIVAKWFNRNEKGEFNMDLVSQRGNYDASALEISIAKSSERGLAMLADAGEDLIKNTFVIVNDYKFTNKEEVAKKTSKWLNVISKVAAYVPGGSTISSAATYTSLGVSAIGKGFVIKTTSYLYRLVWNEEVANTFYNNYWIDKNSFDSSKKDAFNNSNLFQLELIGSENAWADIQSTIFTKKSNGDLIKMATIKATDKAIAKLQRKFETFRTKSPLISGDPISARIGLKEGVEKGDKYEVLEQVLNNDGSKEYKRVGIIKVDKTQIWDNSFMADAINNSEYKYTTFNGSKNKFFAGMLIRQIN